MSTVREVATRVLCLNGQKATYMSATDVPAPVLATSVSPALAEVVRAHGAVAMGLVKTPEEATAKRPHTPKLAFVARPAAYTASDGKAVAAESIDMLARIFSMGQLHHAMTGTGAVAIAAAAAIPGTLVHRVAPARADARVRFGHPSGSLSVGAEASERAGSWTVTKVFMSRSARRLMEGFVRVPEA